jgi:hypothetical protein
MFGTGGLEAGRLNAFMFYVFREQFAHFFGKFMPHRRRGEALKYPPLKHQLSHSLQRFACHQPCHVQLKKSSSLPEV